MADPDLFAEEEVPGVVPALFTAPRAGDHQDRGGSGGPAVGLESKVSTVELELPEPWRPPIPPDAGEPGTWPGSQRIRTVS